MIHARQLRGTLAAVAAAIALAGCGGGGGNSGGFFPGAGIPSAGGGNSDPGDSNYNKFVQYVKDTAATMMDTAEPVDAVALFEPPPTSETRDPISTE